MMMLFGLQTKWNQNHHKTYTLRINKIFKFYPIWYFLVSTYTNYSYEVLSLGINVYGCLLVVILLF